MKKKSNNLITTAKNKPDLGIFESSTKSRKQNQSYLRWSSLSSIRQFYIFSFIIITYHQHFVRFTIFVSLLSYLFSLSAGILVIMGDYFCKNSSLPKYSYHLNGKADIYYNYWFLTIKFSETWILILIQALIPLIKLEKDDWQI